MFRYDYDRPGACSVDIESLSVEEAPARLMECPGSAGWLLYYNDAAGFERDRLWWAASALVFGLAAGWFAAKRF